MKKLFLIGALALTLTACDQHTKTVVDTAIVTTAIVCIATGC